MILEKKTSTTEETVLSVSLADRTLELKIRVEDGGERRYIIAVRTSAMFLPLSLDGDEIEALQHLLSKARYDGLIPSTAETVIAG